ncbi:hypothetical protein [Chitinophaga caseinilytica]|uniref:Uncharacterized protein n=1 Tax=Chitinophaga caseinilytica TaxID=2267521 RepID=A0ABZ2YZU1_9BACT
MTIETLLANFEFQEAPSGPEAEQLLQKIDFQVDGDWLSFALRHNGAYGEIGTYYVAFWTIDEICALNPYYAPENDDGYSSSLFFSHRTGAMLGSPYGRRMAFSSKCRTSACLPKNPLKWARIFWLFYGTCPNIDALPSLRNLSFS